MSSNVMSVNGPIDATSLGNTAMHEHVLIDLFRITRQSDFLLNDVRLATDEVRLFKQAGGGTIVDVTTPDLGREPLSLQRISKATGVNIVMGCGWYRQPFYPPEIDEMTVDQISARIIGDIEDGVEDSGIRPGIIGEIGSDKHYVSAQEERVFRAAARSSQATGLAITTHTSFSNVGLQQLQILEEEGCDLRRVVIGHCDTYLDLDYHLAILEKGAYIQFDSVGSMYIYPDWYRIELLRQLVDRGYESQILLSCDVCRKSYWKTYGGIGYGYWLSDFLPMLKADGFSSSTIEEMVVANPRRVLQVSD